MGEWNWNEAKVIGQYGRSMWDIVRQATIQSVRCHSKYKMRFGRKFVCQTATISQVRPKFRCTANSPGWIGWRWWICEKTGIAVCLCVWKRQQINKWRTGTVRRPETYVTTSNLQCLCESNEISVFFFSFCQLWYFFNLRKWMATLAPFPVGHRSHALSCLDNRLWKIVPGSCRWTQISQNEQRFNLRLHQF